MKQSPIHTVKKELLHEQNMLTLESVYKDYAHDVCRYFCAYTHDMMSAEDMTHDLFLKLASVDIINKSTIRALLFTMASRMMVDDARHKSYIRQHERDAMAEMEFFDAYSVERKMDKDFMAQVISMRLKKMSSRCADVYTLYFREGKHAKEIAKEMQIGVRTVEGYIYNSRKQMSEYLLRVFNM